MVASVLEKRERMVSRLLIESLFAGSRSMAAFPLRAVYKTRPCSKGDAPVQLLLSVPKKHFHHAVDRNRIKRQLREAYRLHKALLYEALPPDEQLLLALIWLSDTQLTTREVEGRVLSLMQRMAEKL